MKKTAKSIRSGKWRSEATHSVVSHLSTGFSAMKQFFREIPVRAIVSLFQTKLLHQEGVALSRTAINSIKPKKTGAAKYFMFVGVENGLPAARSKVSIMTDTHVDDLSDKSD
jgi:hypothetical protein